MSIRNVLAIVAALSLPGVVHAIPITWTYSGSCSAGDCGIIGDISGVITGNPEALSFGDGDELESFSILGTEIASYSFVTTGGFSISGSGLSALGEYVLDGAGNIVGGSMSFGDLFSLTYAGLGSASWVFADVYTYTGTCSFWGHSWPCLKHGYAEAGGSGSYASTTPIPEPGTLVLVGGGLLGLAMARRKRPVQLERS